MSIVSALEDAGLFKRLSEDKELWWVIVGVDGSGKAVVAAEGGTSLDDMKANLSDDLLQFGCFKVLGVDTKVRTFHTLFFRSSSRDWFRP